jgi:phage tail-like protein
MPPGERVDPYRAFNFRVEGLEVASFSEVSGLSSDGDAVDYREGTDVALSVRKMSGLRKWNNVTFKKGVTQNLVIWNWYQNIVNGVRDRRNCTVVLQNEEHVDVLRFHLENAYVNKFEISTFTATGNDVAVETIELVHEGLTVEAA